MCCNHLADSFNFISSICQLLLSHLIKQTNETTVTHGKPTCIGSILNEKSYRMAFDILNKLTLDNRIFLIDNYVKQFIQLAIRRIFEGSNASSFIQFLSNAIRNNKRELEAILHASDYFYSFCRRLMKMLVKLKDNLFIYFDLLKKI
jgi:hypothetical protein